MKTHTFILIIEKVSAAGLSEGEVSAYLGLIKKEIKTDVLICPQCPHCTRGKARATLLLLFETNMSATFEMFSCCVQINPINPLTPNDPYRGRTAPLNCKVAFYIFIQQI
jgi:hypothetical protein